MKLSGGNKTTLYAGIFVLALVVGMLVMNGIGMGVRASSETSDFQMNGSKLVTYTGTGKAVDIPTSVTEIGDRAFADNTTIESVTMPLTVTAIGFRAFSGCTALKSVDIPDSVRKVGPGAFYDCTSLSDVNIGEAVSSWGSGVFAGCTALKTAAIDSDNQYLIVDAGALYSGNQAMLYQVFGGREGDSYVMPGTVKTIDTYAFWKCQNLKNVAVGGSVSEIAAYAMTNMNSVENVVLPVSVNTISEKAFADNTALKQIQIPVSVTSIHETSFDNCPNLKILTDTSTVAQQYAQQHNIPVISEPEYETEFLDSQVSHLNGNPVNDREETESQTQNNQTNAQPSQNQENGDREEQSGQNASDHTENNDTSASTGSTWLAQSPLDTPEPEEVKGKTIIVNGKAVVLMNNTQAAVYGAGSQSEDTEAENPSNERNGEQNEADTSSEVNSQISDRAYYKRSDLTEYTIDDRITSIGKLAFARTGLQAVDIPESVTYIGYGAFYHCNDLADITIPDTVQVIEAKAFEHTAWLDGFLEGSEEISDHDFLIVGEGILLAYRGTSEQVEIPDSVKQVGAEAFKNHTEIISVQVPDSVQDIGANAFAGCSKLEGLTGCKGIKTIVKGAFQGTLVTDETYLKQ